MKQLLEDIRDERDCVDSLPRGIGRTVKNRMIWHGGNALMAAGGLLHTAGNRLQGSPWYDNTEQAHVGGLDEGRRMGLEDGRRLAMDHLIELFRAERAAKQTAA